MRTLRNLSLLVAVLLLGGCITPQKAAYKSLETVGLSAQKAMYAAAASLNAGKISRADWDTKIKPAHEKFRVSYNTACDLAGYDYSKFAPAEVVRLVGELLTTIDLLIK